MSELGPEIAAEIFAACQSGADEAASAIGRAFDGEFELAAAEAEPLAADALPEGLTGAGLVLVLQAESGAALIALAESSGLVPPWCAAPDATGQSKLETLAQELGVVLLPDDHAATEFKAGRVADLQAALARGGVDESAMAAPLQLQHEGKNATLYLVWPVANPDAVIGSAEEIEADTASADQAAAPSDKAESAAMPSASAPAKEDSLHAGESTSHLPPYARSLLKIKVPVVVRLASTKQPVRRIVELGPGSIIQFAKRCDETLNLEIGGQDVAEGEAVKVGDKFGLRITSVILPDERFIAVRGRRET